MATPPIADGKMTVEALFDALMQRAGGASEAVATEATARGLPAGILGKQAGTAGKLLKGAAKLPFKAAGAPLVGGFLLYDLISSLSQGRAHVRETERATRPRTAEDMLAELDEQRSRQASLASVAQNDPELLERLSWMLSGQQQPDLTPNQVMFGATPTARDVPPEALQEAIAAMLG